ncbi:hypothetical protein CRUP_000047, partial [Coryphaenoides rupestris]
MYCPSISSPGRDSPSVGDPVEIKPVESFREPLGVASLSLSDHRGNRVDLRCNVTLSSNSPDVPAPDLSLPDATPIPVAVSLALECPAERESYESLWRILAYYSETAVRLEREIMLSKPPALAYRYRQSAETEGHYHTGVKASVKATPHWMLQPAVSLQLNRAQSSARKVQVTLMTRVSVHPDPINRRSPPPSLAVAAPTILHPWAMISSLRAPTAYSATAGSRAELSCPVVSSGNLKLHWILPDGSKLIYPYSSADGRIQITDSGLILQRSESLDTGLYYCVALAGSDVDVLPIRLAVEESSVVSTGEQAGPSVTGLVGEAVILPCNVSGSPTAEISWLLPDGNIVQHGKTVPSGVSVHSNGSLSMPQGSLKDVGSYRCMAVNQYGTESLSMRLDVYPRARPPFRTSFHRGPQSAAGRSTRIRAPLLQDTVLEEGSGDNVEEENPEIPVVNRRRPQFPLNRRFPNGHPRRRGPIRGGKPIRKGVFPGPGRNRFDSRTRGGATKQRLDPQKWADLLAKIRQRTTLNSTSPPTEAEEPTLEPLENDGSRTLLPQTPENSLPRGETETDVSSQGHVPSDKHTDEASLQHVEEVEIPVVRSRPRISDPHIRSASVPAGSSARLDWVVMSAHSRAQRFEVLPNGTFVIRDVQQQDRGTYICTAQSFLGRDRMLTTLEVWSRPPRMKLANYREATIHQGGELYLDCQAEAVPAPLLSWVLPDRSVLTSNSSHRRMTMHGNGTLHISVTSPHDRGVYRCVSSLPPAIHQPREERLVLTPGAPVYAHCSARGAPPPTLRWRIPDGTLVRPSQFLHGNLFVLPNGTLHIRSLGPGDGGDYECTASNAVGVARRRVSVRVQGDAANGGGAISTPTRPGSRPSGPLTIPKTSVPTDRTGTSLLLPSPPLSPPSSDPGPPTSPRPTPKINSAGAPPPPTHSLDVNQAKPASDLPSASDKTRASHPVLNKTAAASALTPGDRSSVPAARPDWSVAASPLSKAHIVSTSPSAIAVHYGGDLQLHCSVSGNPTPTIVWRTPARKLVDMHFSFDRRMKVHPNGTLLVQVVTERDAGDYLCIARNKVADDYRLIHVTVATKPAKIDSKLPSNKMVDCLASGQPDPAVSWSLPDGTMVNSVLQGEERGGRGAWLTVFHNGTLLVPAVGMKEEGEYTCYAKNHGGQDTMKVKVKVTMNSAPACADDRGYDVIKVRQGATTVLRCRVKGDPVPTVTWFSPNHRRVVVVSDGTLEVRAAQTGDAGNYTCQARNTAGERSRMVGLEVEASYYYAPNSRVTNRHGSGSVINPGGSVGDMRQNGDFHHGSTSNRGTGNAAPTTVSVVTSVKHRAVQGLDVILPCPSHGSPPPRLYWLLPGNGVLPAPYYGSRLTVHRNGSLELRGVRASDGGRWSVWCRVRGGRPGYRWSCLSPGQGGQGMSRPCRWDRLGRDPCSLAPETHASPRDRLAPLTLRLCCRRCSSAREAPPGRRFHREVRFHPLRPPRAAGTALVSAPVRDEQKPAVSSRTGALVSIINGENLRLSCHPPHSPGAPQASFSWTLPRGEVLSAGESAGSGRYTVQRDGTLQVQQATVFDRGSYVCRSTVPGSATASVVTVPVIVIAYPPRITKGPSPVTYTRPGVAVELPCLTIATPRATVTWETPDLTQLRVTGQARIYGNRYLSAQGSLVIQNPTSRDTGFYRCTAKN